MDNIVYDQRGVQLVHGDARSLSLVEPGSVSLVVTSPPYWNLKRYDVKAGFMGPYAEYLADIGTVAMNLKRVVQPGRFVCWVVGTRVSDGRLYHIPADTIRVFDTCGFTLRKEIIWTKPKGTQGLWQRGTTQFLKDKPYPCCANFNIQHETVLVFQAPGEFDPPHEERLPEPIIKDWAWSVWELPVSRVKGHPAPFPQKLAERLILLYSYTGELVLDPFAGTGTTLIAARLLGMRGIGYEISEEYCKLAKSLLAGM